MCSKCEPKQTVYGKIELENGTIMDWLLFIDASLPRDQAEQEAIRIKSFWWKGVTKRCWITSEAENRKTFSDQTKLIDQTNNFEAMFS